MNIEGLDEIDNRILDVICENARLTYREIGERVGISRVSVKARMRAMEEKGIIRGYHTVINPTAAPEGIRFVMDLECRPDSYGDVTEYLAHEKMIRQIYGLSGECRLHAAGFASNSRNLENFAKTIYREKLGVNRIAVHTILSTLMDRDGGVEYERKTEPEHLEREE
jgi:DNA-binding Lrp family transcriptional regulator